MTYVTLVAVLIATLVVFLPTRKNFSSSCEELINRMPVTQYELLCSYIITEPKGQDEAFWAVSNRYHGLFTRVYVSFLCLRLVQAYRREGKISREDARLIRAKMTAQIVYTIVALPEALACRVLRDTRHLAARESLRFYCELIIETNVACVTNHAPECMLRLPELL